MPQISGFPVSKLDFLNSIFEIRFFKRGFNPIFKRGFNPIFKIGF